MFIVEAHEKDSVFNKNEISFVVTEIIDGGLHLKI